MFVCLSVFLSLSPFSSSAPFAPPPLSVALFVCCYFSASCASNFSATSCLAIILFAAGVDVDARIAAVAAACAVGAACGWQRCQVLHPFPVDSQWRVNRICFNLNLFAAHHSKPPPSLSFSHYSYPCLFSPCFPRIARCLTKSNNFMQLKPFFIKNANFKCKTNSSHVKHHDSHTHSYVSTSHTDAKHFATHATHLAEAPSLGGVFVFMQLGSSSGPGT